MTIQFILEEIKYNFDSLISEDIGELAEVCKTQKKPLFLTAIPIFNGKKVRYDFFETKKFNTYLNGLDNENKKRINPNNRELIQEIIYVANMNILNLDVFSVLPGKKAPVTIDETNAFAYAYDEEVKNLSLKDQITYANIFLENESVSKNPFWIEQIHQTISKIWFYSKKIPDVWVDLGELYKKTKHPLIQTCLYVQEGCSSDIDLPKLGLKESLRDPFKFTLLAEAEDFKNEDLSESAFENALEVELDNPRLWRLYAKFNTIKALELLCRYAKIDSFYARYVVWLMPYVKLEYPIELIQVVEMAAKQLPKQESLHEFLANHFHRGIQDNEKNIDISIKHLQEELRINFYNINCHMFLGLNLFKKKKYMQACFHLEFALEYDTNKVSAHYLLSKIRFQFNQMKLAISHAEMYLKHYFDDELYGLLGYAYYSLGDTENSKIHIAKSDKSALAQSALGMMARDSSNDVDALKYANKALEIDSQCPQALLLVGDLKNNTESIKNYKQALEIDFYNFAAQMRIGNYYKINNDCIAYTYFKRALEMSPANSLAQSEYTAVGERIKNLICMDNLADDDGIRSILGELAFISGNYEDALDWSVQAMKINYENILSIVIQMKVFLKKNLLLANVDLQECLDNSSDTELWILVSQALLFQNRYPSAKDVLIRVLNLVPAHINAHLLYGISCMKTLNWLEAIFHFQEVLKIEPENEHALSCLLHAYDHVKGYDDEKNFLELNLKIINENSYFLNKLIVRCIKKNNGYYLDIVDGFEKMQNSWHSLYKFYDKNFYKLYGNYLFELSEGLIQENENAVTWLVKAYDVLKKAVQVQRNDLVTRNNLAKIQLRLVNDEFQVDDYEQHFDSVPEEEKVHYITRGDYYVVLGEIYFDLTNYSMAGNCVEKVFTDTQKNDRALVLKGRLEEVSGSTESAIEYYTSAISSNSNNSQAYFLLGSRLYDKKEFENAREFFEKCVDLDPYNDQAFVFLAEIALQAKKMNLADEYAGTALQINPDNKDAIRISESL